MRFKFSVKTSKKRSIRMKKISQCFNLSIHHLKMAIHYNNNNKLSNNFNLLSIYFVTFTMCVIAEEKLIYFDMANKIALISPD